MPGTSKLSRGGIAGFFVDAWFDGGFCFFCRSWDGEKLKDLAT